MRSCSSLHHKRASPASDKPRQPRATTALTYPEACADPNLFGPWFAGPTWAAWRVIDKAIFGEPLDPDERAIFRDLTGRDLPPAEPASEAWIIVGRRGGKDVKAASYATYLATIGAELYGYRSRLTRGERGVVQLLAVDRDQARICLDYTRAFFEQPMLAKLVRRMTAETIELDNNIAIEITTADRRRVRGRTVIAAILDEVAHWRSEDTANPDTHIYQSIRPAMLTIPGALLIGISSPHARRGLLWRKFQDHHGKDGRTLVVKAPTWVMNPTASRDSELIAEDYRRDPAWAEAEYGAEFRSDIEAFLSLEAIAAVTSKGVRERAPDFGVHYVGFVDPSGGSADSFTLAIAHKDGDKAVLDLIREARPPFSPESVVAEFAATLGRYRISSITGDRYAGEWPREQFRKLGIDYLPSAKSKSELYLDLLPAINSKACDLLDHDRLASQLAALERRTARGGRDSIDHPPNAHDDIANAVAGALVGLTADAAWLETVSLCAPIFIEQDAPSWPEFGFRGGVI